MAEKYDLEKLKSEAYRLYQLDWMAGHGMSVTDLVKSVFDFMVSGSDPEDPETSDLARIDITEQYRSWELDSGFGGSLWACRDEFLGSEFRDPDYMQHLLADENLYNFWLGLWKQELI